MNLGTNPLVTQLATMASSVVDSVNKQRLSVVGLCADGLQRAATGLHLAQEEDLRNVRARVHQIERALPALLHTGLGKPLPVDPRPAPVPAPDPEPPLPSRATVPPPTSSRGARPPRRSFARSAGVSEQRGRREAEVVVGEVVPVQAAQTPQSAGAEVGAADGAAARKTTAKKTAAKKTTAKKTTAKKTAAKKAAAVKSTPAKTSAGEGSAAPSPSESPADAGSGTPTQSAGPPRPGDPAGTGRHGSAPVGESASEPGDLTHE